MQKVMPLVDKSLFCQILVVDGGSTDGTVGIARSMGFDVVVQKKPGMRSAYMEALPFVKGRSILTFSPDGNSLPEDLPLLIKKFSGHDMVIASRYLNGAKSYDDDMITGFGNWLFTRSINLFHRARYTDAMVIYRIYRKSIIHQLGLLDYNSYGYAEKLFRTNISWEPLLSIRAARAGLRVAEIPSDEPARVGGVRKLQILKWGAAYYLQILTEIFTDWRRK
jgi:glycosyltransferase involved in cell wall biosynthesis